MSWKHGRCKGIKAPSSCLVAGCRNAFLREEKSWIGDGRPIIADNSQPAFPPTPLPCHSRYHSKRQVHPMPQKDERGLQDDGGGPARQCQLLSVWPQPTVSPVIGSLVSSGGGSQDSSLQALTIWCCSASFSFPAVIGLAATQQYQAVGDTMDTSSEFCTSCLPLASY